MRNFYVNIKSLMKNIRKLMKELIKSMRTFIVLRKGYKKFKTLGVKQNLPFI